MNKDLSVPVNIKQAVPFFMVRNMERSLHFYLDGLGFDLKLKWEPRGQVEWCWLELDSVAIMLQEYRVDIPDGKPGVGVSICFICEDALSFYENILTRNVSADEPFVGNQMWVVGLEDPDGYRLYFESYTDVPEETVYSEWRSK